MELKFDVSGMTCAACSARVEKVTSQISGVNKCKVNLLAGKMVVETTTDLSEQIIQEVNKAGYQASLTNGSKKAEVKITDDPLRDMRKRIIGSAICLVILMYFTMAICTGRYGRLKLY